MKPRVYVETTVVRLTPMWTDPIVAGIRKTRAEHAAKLHYDLEAIYRDLKEKESKSGRTYVRYAARRCEPSLSQSPAHTA
jgi:hypothetical protein